MKVSMRALYMLLCVTLSACTGHRWPAAAAAASDEIGVAVAVTNEGDEPLRCTILFGHWVEQAVGRIEPGATLEVPMRRQAGDGALFVARDDGRRMMVENLICGPLTNWWERRADLPLLPLRAGVERQFHAACRLDGRLTCSPPSAR